MCQSCGWERFVDDIYDMLAERRYEYAEATLKGILKTVSERRHATENQARAVENIQRGGSR